MRGGWTKPAAWLGGLLLAVLALSLGRLPATWADRWLQGASDGRLRLAAASGSLWRGEGLLTGAGHDGALLGGRPLAWQVLGDRLWHGEIGLAACLGCADPARAGQGVLYFSVDGWRLTAGRLELPAPLLTAALPLAAARGGWRGEAGLHSQGLACDRQWHCQGSAELRWQGAASALLPGRRLGDYRLVLRGDGAAARLELNTEDGEVRLSGSGRLRPDGNVEFAGTAEGPPELVDRLPNIAAPYGRPGDAPGRASIVFP